MKIYKKEKNELIEFKYIEVGKCFKFEEFYYMKLPKDANITLNAISLESPFSFEIFNENEMIQSINLVGVIDYESQND